MLLLTIAVCATWAQRGWLTAADFNNARLIDDVGVFLTDSDFAAGRQLSKAQLYQNSGRSRLSQQRYFRGDIKFKKAPNLAADSDNVRRNGVRPRDRKWANARIPYIMSSQYSVRERAVLARAIDEYHSKTCIRFVPKSASDRDYIFIGKVDGCFSDVGRAGGRQELSLDNGCLEYDTAIHELMHAVGFYHEHERWDRDDYIDIMWQNIDREAYDQFGRVDLYESSYYNQPYDYYSIMHYDKQAFSKNGYETIMPKDRRLTRIIGMQLDFSPVDIAKINQMYSCPRRSDSVIVPTTAAPPPTTRAAVVTAAPWQTSRAPPARPTAAATPRPVVQPLPWQNTNACKDQATLCWRWLDRCTSYFFERIMREFCALSCGFCTPVNTG